MDSISIKVPVTVKAKLTEKLRAKMLKEMEEAIQHINTSRQERQRRVDYVEETRAHQEELQKFAEGAEIVQGTLERQVEAKVGDDMRELMNVEILVEDDKIVAIRS